MWGMIAKTIPESFWVGAIVGALLVSAGVALSAYIISFLLRHWKAILILSAIVGAVGMWL